MSQAQSCWAPSGLPTFDRSKLTAGEVRVVATTESADSLRTRKGFGVAVIDEGANEYDVPAGEDHALVYTFVRRENLVTDLPGRRSRVTMPAGSVTVIPAFQPSYWSNEHAGGRMVHLHLPPETVERWVENGGKQGELPPVLGKRDPELGRCFETLSRELLDPAPHGAMMIEALALQIAVLANRKYASAFSAELVKGGLAPWQLRQTSEYLRDSLGDDITIDMLAGLAGLSKYHFMRAFKQSTGITVLQALTDCRMEKACELLGNTRLPVNEIASRVGYRAPQAFAKVFRRETGAAPAEYRRARGKLSRQAGAR